MTFQTNSFIKSKLSSVLELIKDTPILTLILSIQFLLPAILILVVFSTSASAQLSHAQSSVRFKSPGDELITADGYSTPTQREARLFPHPHYSDGDTDFDANEIATIDGSVLPTKTDIFQRARQVSTILTFTTNRNEVIGDGFTYGFWVVNDKRENSPHCFGQSICIPIVYVPIEKTINDNLKSGDQVTSTLTIKVRDDSLTVLSTVRLTMTITASINQPIVSFAENLEIDVFEGEVAAVPFSVVNPLAEGATNIQIPYTTGPFTSDSSQSNLNAIVNTDYAVGSAPSIGPGQRSGSIMINTNDNNTYNEINKKFNVVISNPGSNSSYKVRATRNTATVNILNDDPLTIVPHIRECQNDIIPDYVTPNVQTAFSNIPTSPYYTGSTHIVRVNFFDPADPTMTKTHSDEIGYAVRTAGAADATGNPEVFVIKDEPGFNFPLSTPTDFTGYLRYRIGMATATNPDDGRFYDIIEPCEFHLWHVNSDRPGISVEVVEKQVDEGFPFTVRVTSTPAPSRDILVPLIFSDETRVVIPENQGILIEKNETSATMEVFSVSMAGDQQNQSITVSTKWSGRYWLDSGELSDDVMLSDHDSVLAGFKDSSVNIEVNESSDVSLEVELTPTPTRDVTVTYMVTDDGAMLDHDYLLPNVKAVNITQGSSNGTIPIRLIDDSVYEEIERFTVQITNNTSGGTIVGMNGTATVSINSDDTLVPTTPSISCQDAQAHPPPVNPQNPLLQVAFDDLPDDVYLATTHTARVNFYDPANPMIFKPSSVGSIYYIAVLRADESELAPLIQNNIGATQLGYNFDISRPANFSGYARYRIVPRGANIANDPKYYDIIAPCEFNIWWVTKDKPGITLSIEKTTVEEGDKFTITATATPAPTNDLNIPIKFSNPSLVSVAQNSSIKILGGVDMGTMDITAARSVVGMSEELTVTANWSGHYWLDDSKNSDRINITKGPYVGFTENYAVVDEDSGSLSLMLDSKLDNYEHEIVVDFEIIDGGTAMENADFMVPDPLQVTIQEGQTTGELTIQILKNVEIEQLETFSIRITNVSHGLIDAKNRIVTIAITEADTISLFAAPESIIAGDVANIILYLGTSPESQKEFQINVWQEPDLDLVAFRVPRFITVMPGEQSAEFPIVTNPHGLRPGVEPESIMIELMDMEDETTFGPIQVEVKPPLSEEDVPEVSVAGVVLRAILDYTAEEFDNAPEMTVSQSPHRIQINSTNSIVKEGEMIIFELSVTGDEVLRQSVTVYVDVTESGDFINAERMHASVIERGEKSSQLKIQTIDDNLAEYDNTVLATLLPGPDYLVSEQNISTVVVKDDIDRENRNQQISASNMIILPSLAAVMGDRSLKVATTRVSHLLSHIQNPVIELGGQTTLKGVLKEGGTIFNASEVKWREVLGDSAMSFELYPEDNGTSALSIWALGNHRIFPNHTSNSPTWNGEVFTGHFGFDNRIEQNTVLGLAGTFSEADAGFNEHEPEKLDYRIQNMGVQPYIGIMSDSGNFQLHSTMGYGSGKINIEQDQYNPLVLNSRHYLVAMNLKQNFYSVEGILGGTGMIGLSGEGWRVEQLVEPNEKYIDPMTVSVGYLRGATEFTFTQELSSHQTLNQEITLGILEKSNGKISNSGMEISGGLKFADLSGVNASVLGGIIVNETGSVHEWKIQNTNEIDPEFDSRGIMVKFSPAWSKSGTGFNNSVWNNGLEEVKLTSLTNTNGWSIDSELGYGFGNVNDGGLINPYGGLNLSQFGQSEFYMGNRFSKSQAIRFDLKGSFSSIDGNGYENKFLWSGNLSW